MNHRELLLEVIERHWGYSEFRPLQEPAMVAALERRDSLVVLPTGGGKSLCYQAPAVARGKLTVVVSPLISLMKDQVDSLRACGVEAWCLNSSQSPSERRDAERALVERDVPLLFVSPERLVMSSFLELASNLGVDTLAIDEAHCISHWGHDFRPEYRQLSRLRELLPGVTIHAYTATATEQVRDDIVRQLALQEPEILIGSFDRPNLTYRVTPRRDVVQQVGEVLARHPGEAGIIYCIRRSDVDELTAALRSRGIEAMAYHAGLSAEQRASTQEAFADERCDLIVATVAFGMGIDRSNVRFVVHTAMPKSIEHYQQESGRAGRDGLEAECTLFHSGGDAMLWRSMIDKGPRPEGDDGFFERSTRLIDEIDRYARGAACRHRTLVEYFGQPFERDSCNACDVCLGELTPVEDATVIAQKILSCVARVRERFGANHIADILRGAKTERLRTIGHDQLTTYGLLSKHSKIEIRAWIDQLIGQRLLEVTTGEYPLLRLNDASWQVLRSEREARLNQVDPPKKQGGADDLWAGVDRQLFELLRSVRRELAAEQNVPPYVVFSDASLREMAKSRPSTVEAFGRVSGVGATKQSRYGEAFVDAIVSSCRERKLEMDCFGYSAAPRRQSVSSRSNEPKALAMQLFGEGVPLDEVAARTGRALSTVGNYLAEWIVENRVDEIGQWVDRAVKERIAAALVAHYEGAMKPVYEALGGEVPYEQIRIVIAWQEVVASAAPAN
jgi:ATP-dependent DNA helicase RecQ